MERIRLRVDGVGEFVVTGGCEIRVAATPGAFPESIEAARQGPARRFLLQQRGLIVLHAAAVRLGHRAVALLGSSGSGKSTLAAALLARGHRLMAEDILAVEPGTQIVLGETGAHLRLRSDVIEALGHDPRQLRQLDGGKLALPAAISEGGDRLVRLYALSEGEQLEMTPITPASVLLEMLRGSPATPLARFGGGRRHLDALAALAGAVPARRVQRPWSLAALGAAAALIEADLEP